MSYLFWLGIPCFLLIVGGLLFKVLKKVDCEAISGIAMIFGGFWLFISLLVWPVAYCDRLSGIKKFNGTKATIEVFRSQGKLHENTALILKATEMNAWLEKSQYWAGKPLLKMLYPQIILSMEPIN